MGSNSGCLVAACLEGAEMYIDGHREHDAAVAAMFEDPTVTTAIMWPGAQLSNARSYGCWIWELPCDACVLFLQCMAAPRVPPPSSSGITILGAIRSAYSLLRCCTCGGAVVPD